jgi:hypothetical protein
VLPSLERVAVRGKDLEAKARHGDGEAHLQQLDIYDGPQIHYRPASASNAWIEIPFEVAKKEPLRLLIRATVADDYGRYQASLDGVKLGRTLDFFGAEIADREFHLLDFWPEPGRHTLRLEATGRNPQSGGFYCGLESVLLRERRPRVAGYGFDKDKDWRQSPALYR